MFGSVIYIRIGFHSYTRHAVLKAYTRTPCRFIYVACLISVKEAGKLDKTLREREREREGGGDESSP